MMTASKAFIAFCLLALAGIALAIGPAELRRWLPGGSRTDVAGAVRPEAKVEAEAEAKVERQPEAKPEPQRADAASAAPVAPVPAEPKAAPGALAETQKQVTAALGDLAQVKPPPAAEGNGPRFDVARIDDHGEAAVIAGQAAPGAKIELLRDGQPLDTVVANAAGQFVMTPPRLPAGTYELTLRAKAPDGTVTQSGRSVPVTIAEVAPPPSVAARADAAPAIKQAARPSEKPDLKDAVAALPSAAPRLASAPDRAAIRPRMAAPKPKVMARIPDETSAATTAPADIVSGPTAGSSGTRVISRGDSLWTLSRLAYGDGARYALIFKANRDKIHNPNLIYPGQTFVMPQKPPGSGVR